MAEIVKFLEASRLFVELDNIRFLPFTGETFKSPNDSEDVEKSTLETVTSFNN